MEQIFYDWNTDQIPGKTNLLQGRFYSDVDQLGGRFYNVTDEYGNMIGIIHNRQNPVHNDECYFWGTQYENSENNPVIIRSFHQRCLNGEVLRFELFFFNLLYSVNIKKDNKVKFKI